MSRFNKRRWSISLDDGAFIDVTDGQEFKATFEVLHDFGGFTSYADIAIYNLSQYTANRTLKRGVKVTLVAGYIDNADMIFVGTIQNVLRERNGPDTVTRLICRGGKLVEDQTQINETLGKDVAVVDIIKACAAAMEYPLVINESTFADVDPYPYGYTLTGDPRVHLDRLADAHDFKYVIENERIVVVRIGNVRDGEPFVVSQFTGMEGIPEITETGVDVTVRMSPKVRIGGAYRLESDLATFTFNSLYWYNIPESAGVGEYQIFKITHTGDTKGDAWSTKITGYRLGNS